MRHFTTLLLLLIAGFSLQAQNDPKAKEILDKSAAKFKSYKAVEVDFNLSMENKAEDIHENHKGQAWMKGNLYKLNVMEVENYYDGKNIYTYMPEANEVSIKNPEEEEEEMLNPTNLFDIHNKGFAQKLVSNDNGVAYIELIPTDKKRNFKKIGIWIDPSTSMIQKVTSFGKDGNDVIITINSIKQPASLPADSFFKFDEKKHPGVEIVDMR